jgi:hypothetical protein
MKLLEFNKKYPTEGSCKIAFKNLREQEGVNCSKCGNTTHYWKKTESNGSVKSVAIEQH